MRKRERGATSPTCWCLLRCPLRRQAANDSLHLARTQLCPPFTNLVLMPPAHKNQRMRTLVPVCSNLHAVADMHCMGAGGPEDHCSSLASDTTAHAGMGGLRSGVCKLFEYAGVMLMGEHGRAGGWVGVRPMTATGAHAPAWPPEPETSQPCAQLSGCVQDCWAQHHTWSQDQSYYGPNKLIGVALNLLPFRRRR